MRAGLDFVLIACWYGSTGCESPTLSSADLQPYEWDQGVDEAIAGETTSAVTEGSGMGGDDLHLGGMTFGGELIG